MNNLTLESAQAMIASGARPTRGRCIIHLDPLPTKSDSGLLHIPDSARGRKINTLAGVGTVLAVMYDSAEYFLRQEDYPFGPGDRVLISLHDEDRDATIIITHNSTILAVLD